MDIQSEEVHDEHSEEKPESGLGELADSINFISNMKKDQETIKKNVIEYLQKIINETGLSEEYNVVFLYNRYDFISNFISDAIYSLLSQTPGYRKDILLILDSLGGYVEPAYLLSKCCKKYSKEKFIVAVPRQAKSAATLLAIGADEIHMGQMSELGPIDPQIEGYPALGLGDAIDYLARVCRVYPESADMLAKYLQGGLQLHILGYLERVSKSAVQYAERLLKGKNLPGNQDPNSVAKDLVYLYQDHRFVIDREEAETLLGKELIKYETREYRLSDKIYNFLELASYISALESNFSKEYRFKIHGNLEDLEVSITQLSG